MSIKIFVNSAAVARHRLIFSQRGAMVITMLLDTSLTAFYAISDHVLTKLVKHLDNYNNVYNLAILL